MTLDEKTRFYLKHWQQIEEWAALRDVAVVTVDAELRSAGSQLAACAPAGARLTRRDSDDEVHPGYLLDRPGWRSDGVTVALAMKWNDAELLNPAESTWPYVGINLQGPAVAQRALTRRLRDELRPQAAELRWDLSDMGWLWWRWVKPRGLEVDPVELREDAVAALLAGWQTLSAPLDGLLLDHEATVRS